MGLSDELNRVKNISKNKTDERNTNLIKIVEKWPRVLEFC
jgi:hypothetical protein